MTRITEDEMYMNIAWAVAARSSCTRLKVGCVIVKDRQIIAEGYNGTLRGADNCCETVTEEWFVDPESHDIAVSSTGRLAVSTRVLDIANTDVSDAVFTSESGTQYAEIPVQGGIGFFNMAYPYGSKQCTVDVAVALAHVYELKYDPIVHFAGTVPSGAHPTAANVAIFERRDGSCVTCVPRDKYSVITNTDTIHAEVNAVYKLARTSNGGDGATVYCTHSPCLECAKALIQVGISRVVYSEGYRLTTGIDLLEANGVSVSMLSQADEDNS